MARKPKISREQRTEMLRLHNEEHWSVSKLAAKYSCSKTAVNTALQAALIEAEDGADTEESETKPQPKKTQINEEFDAAVNEMIAEAEAKAENAEPDKLPGVVCRAIDAGFHDLADEIDKRRNRIEELEAEIAEFEKDIEALRKWREAHK